MTDFSFGPAVPRIVAVQGGATPMIQALLAAFADRVAASGFRLAGAVEKVGTGVGGACSALALRDLTTERIVPISQDLGPGSTSCNIDPGGLAIACLGVEQAIAGGVDLVILSKFAKQEAGRGGLCDAFRAAIAADLPIATAVSPAMVPQWEAFAGTLSIFIPPDEAVLDAWWAAHLARARPTPNARLAAALTEPAA